jgi:biotin carboxylase
MLPVLAVIFNFGSVSPMELILGSNGLCDLLFVCDRESEYAVRSMPLLKSVGTVIEHAEPEHTARLLRDAGVDGIVTFGDAELEVTAQLALRLGLPFHSPTTTALLCDKLAQRTALMQAGVDAVRFAPITTLADIDAAAALVGFPAVLKPRYSAASRNTYPVDTADVLSDAVQRSLDAGERMLILEERLVGDPGVAGHGWGDYVSVESVVRDGRVTHLGVTGKPPLAEPFRETGAFFPSTLASADMAAVSAAASRAITALGVRDGVCHTEVKLTRCGPRIIEVNGRLGGYVNDVYQRSTGATLVRIAMQAALGQPVPDAPLTSRQVAYQLLAAPPVSARRVRSINGVEALLACPGIQRVEVARKPGDAVDWTRGTASAVATAYGVSADHQELAAVTEAMAKCLVVDYDSD